ncbi:hypothetical protein [Streptomyces sp. NPDC051183]|uniref:hypothetical protein n=1 Tax=Streptomyces sp. NPDC051183 TaxID=3155165 RepID=UPI003422E172
MSDAVTSESTDPDVDLLGAVCRELAETADAVGEAARHASELALGARLPATALARVRRRRPAWRTLLRTLTDPAGLGWAPRGRGVAAAGRLAGILAGRESLAVSIAVCGLKARIRAASAGRPELAADPDAAAVLKAVEEDRQGEAVRAFRAIMRDRGPEYAFTLLSPAFADLLAWHALTDDNPFNDHAGWQVATGRAVTAEPLLGFGAACRAFFDRGPGRGDPLPPGTARRITAARAAATRAAAAATAAARVTATAAVARVPSAAAPVRTPAQTPASALRSHAAGLRSHAVRLRAAVVHLCWPGPKGEAFRTEVRGFADRCAVAADGFALAAAQLEAAGSP